MSPPVWHGHVTWVIWCQTQSLACSCVHLVENDAIQKLQKFSVPHCEDDFPDPADPLRTVATVVLTRHSVLWANHTVLGALFLQLQQGLRLCSYFCKDYLDALRMNRAIKAKFWNLCNG